MSYNARVLGVFKDTKTIRKKRGILELSLLAYKSSCFIYCTWPKTVQDMQWKPFSKRYSKCKIVNLVYALSIPCTECDERICISIKWVQLSKCELIDQWSAI